MILQDPTSGIAISYGSCIFFCQSSTLFSIVTAQTYIPTDNDKCSLFSIFSRTLVIFFFFFFFAAAMPVLPDPLTYCARYGFY